MAERKEHFINGEIYHIVSRGIDDNLIYRDDNDYYRGIYSIYEFNNTNPVVIQKRREMRLRFKQGRGKTSTFEDIRDKMVEILTFSLMPNHFHLLLRQIKDGGITEFMRKVGTGYAGYFNRKYNRKGHLFQNKFLSVFVKSEEQLKNLFVYIHSNPISFIESEWKDRGITNPGEALKFIETYKWSSYPDYIGNKSFPSVTERDFMLRIMGEEKGCRDSLENWVRYKGEIKRIAR